LFGDQVPYSLSNREYAENGVLEYCQENGMILTAYTPVEKGKLANNALLQEIAAKHDATPIQVALKWLIRQPQVITIPMSTHIEHLQENLEAVDVQLSEEDVERLDRVVA
jgi:diketogulonate reductase-like aldo/keto reductase